MLPAASRDNVSLLAVGKNSCIVQSKRSKNLKGGNHCKRLEVELLHDAQGGLAPADGSEREAGTVASNVLEGGLLVGAVNVAGLEHQDGLVGAVVDDAVAAAAGVESEPVVDRLAGRVGDLVAVAVADPAAKKEAADRLREQVGHFPAQPRLVEEAQVWRHQLVDAVEAEALARRQVGEAARQHVAAAAQKFDRRARAVS